jgi:hypothetical protein
MQMMYRSVLLSSVCFAIGCCAPLTAQCVNCGNNQAIETNEVYSSYPMEGAIEGTVVGEVIQGGFTGEIVDGTTAGYPVESYPMDSYPVDGYAMQGQAMGAVTYPEYLPTQGQPVQTVSFNAAPSGGMDEVLTIVNRKRMRAGLYALQMDPSLMMVARQKSMNRANRRITGHDNLPKGGASVEGVGYAHGYSDLGSQFNTCYLYSTGYRRAGAAISYDGSGRAYYTLLLR